MGARATIQTLLPHLDDVNSDDDLIYEIKNYIEGLKETSKSKLLTLLNFSPFLTRYRLEVRTLLGVMLVLRPVE